MNQVPGNNRFDKQQGRKSAIHWSTVFLSCISFACLGCEFGSFIKAQLAGSMDDDGEPWEVRDDGDGAYWYNTVTGDTQWCNEEQAGGYSQSYTEGDYETWKDTQVAENGGAWTATVDEVGRQYYVHSVTGESKWAEPTDWQAYVDENGASYLMNSVTGEWIYTLQQVRVCVCDCC